MKYDTYVNRVQKVSPWAGAIAGGLLGFGWGFAHIGVGAALFFGGCGAFAGMLLASIVSWVLVPHVMLVSLGVLVALALPFALIWLCAALFRMR